MKLVLYSKPDCCLCHGLLEKLEQVSEPTLELEIRDITTNLNWFEKYEFSIPVLCRLTALGEEELPRLSPRASVAKVEELLRAMVDVS